MPEHCANDAQRELENLERRQADQRLVQALRDQDFRGRQYRRFEDELARYGMAVLRGWMHAGTVFRLTADRNYLLAPTEWELEELQVNSEVRQDLSSTTVAKALRRFQRQALLEGGWRPDGGASLSTYFVGALLYVFPNEFRAWRAQRRKWQRQDGGDYTVNGLDRGPITDPSTLATGGLWVSERLEQASDREREIIVLSQAGYTYSEIAELLQEASERAVEGVVYRWRTDERGTIKRDERR